LLSPKLPALGEDSVSSSVSAPASFVTAYTTSLTSSSLHIPHG
jgi:hypothetical protein